MYDPSKAKRPGLSPKELKNLRGEFWVILPFFIFSLWVFGGSFQYKFEARTLPMLAGFITAILTGMRLIHIIFPKSKIGAFKETGIAGEFDDLQEGIKEGLLKEHYEETPAKEITFREEKKAFIALIGSFMAFLLFGYLVGTFFVIVGISYYYGYKKKMALFISLIAMYFIVYVILYKLLETPGDFGLVLGPILESLEFI